VGFSGFMRNYIEIRSTKDSLRIVERFVDDASEKYNFSEEIYGNIMIAAMEAANNAILHGNKNDADKYVKIRLIKDKNDLSLVIKDQGNGFDYNSIPDPTSPENIEKISGRGIFLMEKLSDKIEFLDNGSLVRLTFRLK